MTGSPSTRRSSATTSSSAYRYRTELGESGPHVEGLAGRARERLTSAGARAQERGDVPATLRLLAAAAAVSGLDTADGRGIQLDLARVLGEGAGRFSEGTDAARDVLDAARAAGDTRSELRARILLVEQAYLARTMLATDAAYRSELDLLRPLVEADGDRRTLIEFLEIESTALWEAGQPEQAMVVIRRALALAESADMRLTADSYRLTLIETAVRDATPVDAVLAQADAQLRIMTSGVGRAQTLAQMAILRAMKGDADGARATHAESRRLLVELGQRFLVAELGHGSSLIERLAGDEEGELRQIDQWRALRLDAGVLGSDAMVAARRAHVLARLGRMDEARTELALAELEDFSVIQELRHLVRARLLVHEGRAREALREAELAERIARSVAMFRGFLPQVLIEVAWFAATGR